MASKSDLEAIFNEWNIEETETLIKQIEEESKKRKEKEDVTWKTEQEKYYSVLANIIYARTLRLNYY